MIREIINNNLRFAQQIKTRESGQKEVLSEKEILEIFQEPLSKILNYVVEILDEDVLFSLGLITESMFNRLCGEDRKRKYVCSIYAGSIEAVSEFERYLKRKKCVNIERIGIFGFWHYFAKLRRKINLSDLFDKLININQDTKVIDVMIRSYPTTCSMTSSFRYIK